MNEELPYLIQYALGEAPTVTPAEAEEVKPVAPTKEEAPAKPTAPTPPANEAPEPERVVPFEAIQGDIDALLDHEPLNALALLGFDPKELEEVEAIPVENCEIDSTSEVLAAFDEPLPSWP